MASCCGLSSASESTARGIDTNADTNTDMDTGSGRTQMGVSRDGDGRETKSGKG